MAETEGAVEPEGMAETSQTAMKKMKVKLAVVVGNDVKVTNVTLLRSLTLNP